MKHKFRIYAMAALVLCVTCVLAVGAAFTQVATGSEQGDASTPAVQKNTLTVKLSGSESDSSKVSGLKPEVKLYRVANANPDDRYDTYNYEFEEGSPFYSLADEFNQQTYTAEDWKQLVVKAEKIVNDNKISQDRTGTVGETISDLDNGLYLALIPPTANEKYKFTFEPVLVSLPGKTPTYDENGQLNHTTDKGDWTHEVTATYEIDVKWSMEALKGSLEVDKIVDKYSGDPVTFTFRIDGETDNGPYQNFITVSFDKDGKHTQTLNGIPAGYTYRVTEVNSGAGYQSSGLDYRDISIEAGKTYKIQGDEAFRNEPDGSGNKGYGIENHFRFQKDESGGDWKHDDPYELKRPNE